MANIVIFDPTTKYVLRYVKSVNTALFLDRDDVLINPDMTGIDPHNAKVRYRKVVNLTEEEKQNKLERDKRENYIEYRARAYKSIQDQLDMMYWDKVNGTDLWKEHIDAVKAAYPSE